MKLFYTAALFLLSFHIVFACECDNKTSLDIKDWNDTEIIFTGVLTKFSETNGVKNLTFTISRIYKGSIHKKFIDFRAFKEEDEEALHHVEKISLGQTWVVFASKNLKNNTITYTLNEETDDGYCMLTRPINEQDSHLTFIKNIVKKPYLKDYTFYNGKRIFAKGSIQNLQPIGAWKYFSSDNDYWEGNYSNGKRNGKWLHTAKNYKKQNVTIGFDNYTNGKLKERVEYNYVGQKVLHEFHTETTKTRFFYHNKFISSKWIVDKVKRTTLIEKYKNGKLLNTTKKEGILF